MAPAAEYGAAEMGEAAPENCDCCGRDAEDCGIDEQGWLETEPESRLPGSFCLACAALLRLVPWSERCSSCGTRAASESAAERDGWRYFYDRLGQLLPLCPPCTDLELRRDIRRMAGGEV